MLTRAFRCQVRLDLSDIDRQVYARKQIVLAQEPEEPDEHVLLRFLAFVFFYDDNLVDCGGFSLHAEPDLAITDLTGQQTAWIEVGAPARVERLVRALGRMKGGRTIVVVASSEEGTRLLRELGSHRARNLDRLELLSVTPPLLQRLEELGKRSMNWSATLHEGELFLDCDGEVLVGALTAVAR